jgi:hypothetical protein
MVILREVCGLNLPEDDRERSKQVEGQPHIYKALTSYLNFFVYSIFYF